MNRVLQFLALAMVAAASAASPAQGAQLTTEGGKYPATITGSQIGTHQYILGGRTLTCATLKYTASLAAPSSTATGETLSETCHTVVFGSTWPVTVTTNGCTGTVHLTPDKFTIGCPAGKNGEVHIYESHAAHTAGTSVCTYHMPPQTITEGYTYTNTNTGGGKGTIRINIVEAPLAIKRTAGSGLICGSETQTSRYTGVSEAAATVGGVSEGIHIG